MCGEHLLRTAKRKWRDAHCDCFIYQHWRVNTSRYEVCPRCAKKILQQIFHLIPEPWGSSDLPTFSPSLSLSFAPCVCPSRAGQTSVSATCVYLTRVDFVRAFRMCNANTDVNTQTGTKRKAPQSTERSSSLRCRQVMRNNLVKTSHVNTAFCCVEWNVFPLVNFHWSPQKHTPKSTFPNHTQWFLKFWILFNFKTFWRKSKAWLEWRRLSGNVSSCVA